MSRRKTHYFAKREAELSGQLYTLTDQAKRYIVENYQRVQDWSGFKGFIEDSRDRRVRFRPKRDDEYLMRDVFKEFPELQTVEEVVYDPSDGDLSASLNGEWFMWIQNGIIELADYIDKQITNETDNSE